MTKDNKNIIGDNLEILKPENNLHINLPFSEAGVAAGFPSPAENYTDISLDLNEALIRNPSSTFFARVRGVSMIDEGIDDGDLLVIDKSLEAYDGSLAVAFIDGEFTLKRVKIEKDCVWLVPANTNYSPIKVTEDNDFTIWGIVTYLIKDMKNKK
ncbi:MAG: translesion error-prone DNA polymerase V autoproteolytic subunit [Bacteroidales bacterium]